ncbi:hypothetical protein DVH24_025391 [Malus domestica]|uniref:INO80 complex subunit B-like conserved region domain-containing protein n=1 Tax=Malus domestica TaxID=3750 RepID=A0A498HMD2_MALDO|nr:hypothetical protein DVH24_025391 [Malus domestica]
MESLGGAGFSPGGCIVRKKRSIASHKPRLNPPTFSLCSSIPIGKGTIDEDQNNKKKIVHSDGLGNVGNGGGSSTAKSSSSLDAFTPQMNSLAQDDSGGDGLDEPVRKSKRAPKRSTLGAGFNEEDDEDEEIQFLERLSASKVARSERIQMDIRFHGDDSGEYKPSRLGKTSKKRSSSEKMHEDKDYLGEEDEEELTSDDEPEPNGKKLKTGSLSKKEAMSEVERQLKKAEAALRRKVKLENAAREAEGRTGSAVTLAPNTVRWVIGPNGTTVTFSDNIGLPTILPHVKNVRVQTARMHTSIGIPSRSFPCAVSSVTDTRKDAASNCLLIPSPPAHHLEPANMFDIGRWKQDNGKLIKF